MDSPRTAPRQSIQIGLALVVAALGAAVLIVAGGHGGPSAAPATRAGVHAKSPNQGLWIVDTDQAKLVHTVALPPGLYGGSLGGGYGWWTTGTGIVQLSQTTGAVINTFPVKGGAKSVVYAG